MPEKFAARFFKTIVEATRQGVWVIDDEQRSAWMNQRMRDLLRLPIDAQVASPMDFVSPPDRARATEAARDRRARGSVSVELEMVRSDGSSFMAQLETANLLEEDGTFAGAVALVTDVTESRRGLDAQARLAAIVRASGDAIISSTLDGVITSWNSGAERLYGWRAEEVVGKHFSGHRPDVSGDELAKLRELVLAGRSSSFEAVRVRRDGSTVDVRLSVSPIEGAGGPPEVSIIAHDLSERRRQEERVQRAEAQLHHAQKMEAIGRLAGGVAHDFNNLLTVILSYGEMMASEMRGDAPGRAELDEIRGAARRAAALTQQLLLFSRHQPPQLAVVNVDERLRAVHELVGRLVGEHIEVRLAADATDARVRIDPNRLEQVIMNLVVNARDAMPRGGKLTIESSTVDVDAVWALEHPPLKAGPCVCICVTDTGEGMTRETMARIFEPFFTTKEPGRGTGLGLSIVFGIVQQAGGVVVAEGAPGEGARFRVYLPRVAASAVTEQATAKATAGNETILVVEDEAGVRAVTCAILRRAGYTVLEAASGEAALALLETNGARIHLLLTDVVMPGMPGPDLARRVLGRRPGTRILCMSGYTDDAMQPLPAEARFIQKPFTPDALARKVRAVLDERGTDAKGA